MGRVLITIVTVLLFMPFAWGQESDRVPPEDEPHAFEALLDEVLENNPELKFYEAEILAAKGLRTTAGVWSNPEVGGAVGRKRVTGGSEGETLTGSAREVVVTQSVEWPGRIHLRKAIADRDVKLAELGLEQFRATLKARIKIAAYVFSAAQERAAAVNEVAEHFRAMREVLLQRNQAGLTPLLESRVIEAIELNMQRRASQAVLDANTAVFDVNHLRGVAPDEVLVLPRIQLVFHPISVDTNELAKLASAHDFQVRARTIELERQRYDVKLAKNERFPAITAGPALSQERAGERERVIGAELSLPLPLWDRNQGRIATAKAQQSQAEVALDVAQREAARRLVETVAAYNTKLKEMAQWRPDSIEHFKEAAELADRHYRLGAVPLSTYTELQSQYLDAIEGLQQTKQEALEAATQLELMIGKNLSLVEVRAGQSP